MDIHLNRGRAFSPLFRSPRAAVAPACPRPLGRSLHPLRIAWRILLLALLLLFPSTALLAQEFGESVTRSGTVKEDIYLAGSTVNLDVVAEGDVIAAGGNLNIGDEIKGDALLAGGSVTIRGKLRDDVRAAGGTVTLDAEVGDDALLAGGNVVLDPSTCVNGRAWIAGGRLDISGCVGKELKAAGGNIAVSAEIMGDVMLAGETIEIKPGAVIHGDLRYMSPNAATIDKAAVIKGTITHLPSPRHERGAMGTAAAGIGILISLIVTGTVLLLLFPRVTVSVTDRIAQAPWKSLGLGLAVLAATPLVVILLFVSLVGLWLGLILLAAYLVALLVGYLSGVLAAGEIMLKRLRRQTELTRGWRVTALVIMLVVVGVLGPVPGLGGLLIFALMLFGLGGLAWQVNRAIAAK